MCIRCGHIDVAELNELCEPCMIDTRCEVREGIHELESYLEWWAAFATWLERRRPEAD